MISERGQKGKPFQFSYVKMQNVTGFSSATVRQAVKLLSQKGLLYYEHGGLERNPNVYEIEDSWLET